MLGEFRRSVGGYTTSISSDLNHLLRRLMNETLGILDEPAPLSEIVVAVTEPELTRESPDSPTLSRLLPDMSEDNDTAMELRALTEDYLRAEKSDRIRCVLDQLEEISQAGTTKIFVHHEAVWEWLSALNDMRLVLAEELHIVTDDDAERVHQRAQRGDNSRETMMSVVYECVTWWQDSLLQAMQAGMK
ncbi:DUF2017 family protein [Schaalia canis]|uniref:DUF2017 family protein n=1 Tax=Schaalia canis TaxID=100469 RepID=A0A3P1SE38_9ACTO|nr:DUF2017 family protein [Schaalia canis]RRC95279.1 DUF2017 family protein [Schaalia canis]